MQLRHPVTARVAATLALALVVGLALAAPVGATSTYDPATGTGFVSKADVEQAFGWKDQVFQANVRKVSFHAERLVSWSWDCQAGSLTADATSSWTVDALPVGTTVGHRLTAVSGFSLTGPGAVASTDPPASCSSGNPSNVSSATTVVLFADFRGTSQAILTI